MSKPAPTAPTLTSPNGHPLQVVDHLELPAGTYNLPQEYAGHDVRVEIPAGRYPVVEFCSRRSPDPTFYVLVTGRRTSSFWNRIGQHGSIRTETRDDATELLDVIDYCGRGHVRWDGYEAARAARLGR